MSTLRLPEPCIVVLIGAAGSGKSTLAARHFAPDEILSSDAFRAVISGDATDQRVTGPAFRRLHAELDRRSAARRTTVVDATNVTRHARREILSRARAAGLPAVAVVLDLPLNVVSAQNAARIGRMVPEDVVARHLDQLRASLSTVDPGGALRAEGFDPVVILTDPASVAAFRIDHHR